MSLLSAAANDEDGDTIRALRAENNQLRQSLLAMHTTLEMTAKSGAVYARANEGLRDAVIRWANRAEQAEDMLEAIGAGGVGKVEQAQPGGIPPGWKLVPVNITDAMYDAWADDDGDEWTAWKALLAAAPQPPVVERPVEQPSSNESAYQRGYMDGMTKVRRDAMQDRLEQEPVAEVVVSYARVGIDGQYTAEVESRERLSVGAELFIRPQPRQPLTNERIDEDEE